MKLMTSLLLTALLAAGCGTAPVADPDPVIVPSRTVAEANAHIVEAAAEKKRIEDEYLAQEIVCYKRFFVNDCLDAANEERRVASAAQTLKDNEAQHFLRQHALDVRDAEIARNEAEFAAKEADLAIMPPRQAPKVTPVPPPKPSTLAARRAKQAAREQAAAAREAANAGKRADKVAAQEKRRAQSEQRQKDVAQRKAERAKKQADKAASDAAASAAAAADAAKRAAAKQ
jgi:colicin import membrane protein